MTPRGNHGYPNEINLCTEEESDADCRVNNAIMILRFYTSDPDQGMLNRYVGTEGGWVGRWLGE